MSKIERFKAMRVAEFDGFHGYLEVVLASDYEDAVAELEAQRDKWIARTKVELENAERLEAKLKAAETALAAARDEWMNTSEQIAESLDKIERLGIENAALRAERPPLPPSKR